MIPSPPRLRSDLTVSHQQVAGGVRHVVKDPVSGKFFRFGELEWFIAEQLDGETPLDVVRTKTEAAFAGTLDAETLTAFTKKLDKQGLLTRAETAAPEPASVRPPMRGSLLYVRFPLFDPDRLLTALARRTRLCFTRSFVVVSAGAMLLAAITTLSHWSEIPQSLTSLYRLSSIPLFLAISLFVAAAHEFGHGVTCKHFGGDVHELGFMLIYFTPGFYANVSDAWLFPEKAKRMWVGVAGPYIELFIWALATLAWRLTDLETGINHLALMVMTLTGVKTLFNLNPFIKLDGYYVLSDALELPNLRKKSFRFVGNLIKRAVGAGEAMAAEITRRERSIYLVYGLAGAVASLSLLTYVLGKAGGYLIESHQPAALLLGVSFAGMKSRRKFRRLFGGAPDRSDPTDDGDDATEGAPAETPAPKKRRPARKPWVKWAGLGAVVLAIVLFGRMQLRIAGSVSVLPEQNADVRVQVEGIVQDILVDEGDGVQAGDVIARLSNHALLAELQKTEASIRETRAFLRKLETGPTAEEIAAMNASVKRSESQLQFARANVSRMEQLFATTAATRQELEGAQQLATTAENDVTEARARLDLLIRRSRPEDIEASRARLSALETQQRFLEGEVRELTVLSPAAGIVATPTRQLKEMEGQLVSRGALLAKVYDFKTVTAQIIVSEKDIGDVRVGQGVALRVRAYPDVAFEGTVTAVATEGTVNAGTPTAAPATSAATGTSGSRAFVVTTRIENPSLLLKPGMTGRGKIYGGQRHISGLITRRLARTFRLEVWSWW
jgi:putative peptide zinc metalloprotease protein